MHSRVLAVPTFLFSQIQHSPENIIDVMGEVKMWDSYQSKHYLNMPMNTHDTIVRQHSKGTYDCKLGIIDELLINHPYPRWEQWVDLLEGMERRGQARAGLAQEVKDKYITSKPLHMIMLFFPFGYIAGTKPSIYIMCVNSHKYVGNEAKMMY